MSFILNKILSGDTVGEAFGKTNQNIDKQIVSANTSGSNLRFVSLDGTLESVDLNNLVLDDYLPLSGNSTVFGQTSFRFDDGSSLPAAAYFLDNTAKSVTIGGGFITFYHGTGLGGLTTIKNYKSGQTNTVFLPIQNGTLALLSDLTGATSSGNFVPLSGTTYSSPMKGDLVFTGTTTGSIYNGIKTYYDGGSNTGYTFVNGAGITLGTTDGSIIYDLVIQPSFPNLTTTTLSILDTSSGTGNIVTVPEITTQENKFVKVKSDGLGFDFHDNFITITYVNALAAAQDQTGSGTLIPDRWYRIEAVDRNADETINYNTYGDIFLKAISNNRFSPDGYLLAINADYQGAGSYTDVADFNINHGVPYNGITIGSNVSTITDIVIYNNRHWAATAEYTLTDEASITSNLTPLAKDYTTKNGYIIEAQKIVYDVVTGIINRMEDKRGNVVINNNGNFSDYIENFRFGYDNVIQNYVTTPLECAIINYPNLIFSYNNFKFGTISKQTTLISNSVILTIFNCNIQDYFFRNDYQQSLYIIDGNIQDKKILSSERQFTITSSTITLPMDINGQGWFYDQNINATGGTFNGIVTAITQDNQIANYYQKISFANNSGSNIIFRNSQFIKTEGGLDAIIKPNNDNNIEFYISGGIARQTDINNYI